jgi:flagellar biogenesis protein FliO
MKMAKFIHMPFSPAFFDASNSENYLFSLKYVFVVVTFIYLLWIFSRWLTKRNYISLNDRNIKVLERTALSNDKYIILVELENIFYLLGVDKNGIHVIDKRDDLELDTFIPKAGKPNASFSALLKSSMAKKDSKHDDSEQ